VNVMPRSRQRRREVPELPREVLVNEKDLQMGNQIRSCAPGTNSALSSHIDQGSIFSWPARPTAGT
jgi:hypothetical protein